MIQISTIIVSYNTFDLTAAAIEATRTSSPEIEQEIIVVDNHSPDGSGHRLAALYASSTQPPTTILALDSNPGFAAANNIGASKASGEVLFFLNPDTEARPGAIAEIYRFLMDTPDAGAVGPHIVNPDGSDQQSITRELNFRTLFNHYFPLHALWNPGFTRDAGSPAQTEAVEMVAGCALAVRRDAFDRVGGWDDSYFLYAEEGELCYQLKSKGYNNYYLATATIMHHGGASTSQESYAAQQIIQQRSALRFIYRHHSDALALANRMMGLVGFGVRVLVFRTLLFFESDEQLRIRADAAGAIFKWFLLDYSWLERADNTKTITRGP